MKDDQRASDGSRRVWPRALAWVTFLGMFFFASYGFANWAAAQRAQLPSLAFGWEHAIPFWSWSIVPYWSIDVLYAMSFFVCVTRREVDIHGKRLLTAQLIAIACFLAFPLRFSFDRALPDGIAGAMFAALGAFDRPFNQVPSLHIAIAIVLWDVYARRLSGIARVTAASWLILICASVLTTYQHHFIDVPTGALLGVLCLWLWPFDERSIASQWKWTRVPIRWRIASLYCAGALLLAVMGVYISGGALWLLWPALSLLLVALTYAAIGPGAFQKTDDGRLSLAARVLFAPYLAGAWLNARAWTWRNRDAVEIADGVHLGPLPSARELETSRYRAVLDLTAELGSHDLPGARVVVPMLDLVDPPADVLACAATAIERLRAHGPVLVCCALGCSRSACAAAAWLLITGRERDSTSALHRVRCARTGVVLDARHAAALGALERAGATFDAVVSAA